MNTKDQIEEDAYLSKKSQQSRISPDWDPFCKSKDWLDNFDRIFKQPETPKELVK